MRGGRGGEVPGEASQVEFQRPLVRLGVRVPTSNAIEEARLSCMASSFCHSFATANPKPRDGKHFNQVTSQSQKWQIGFEASCEVVSVARSSRSALMCVSKHRRQ